jgi:hypothetical protein
MGAGLRSTLMPRNSSRASFVLRCPEIDAGVGPDDAPLRDMSRRCHRRPRAEEYARYYQALRDNMVDAAALRRIALGENSAHLGPRSPLLANQIVPWHRHHAVACGRATALSTEPKEIRSN